MPHDSNHLKKSLQSQIIIEASSDKIWENITNVQIENFAEPWFFRLLDIPKPLKAEVTSTGIGGQRIAYFDTGKKFIQEITIWNYPNEYSFTFNPEDGFKVGYFFDLSKGVFRMLSGDYTLTSQDKGILLTLNSNYSIHKRLNWLLGLPIYFVLVIFQKYLLESIKKNAELD